MNDEPGNPGPPPGLIRYFSDIALWEKAWNAGVARERALWEKALGDTCDQIHAALNGGDDKSNTGETTNQGGD